MLLSVIIPVFNESKTLKQVIDRVGAVDIPKEIIAVNDGSSDDSLGILKQLADMGQIILVNHEKNMGKGAAIKSSLKVAKGDFIIIQDADLEYYPEDYHKLFEPIFNKKADIVFGSRNLGTNNVPFNRYYFYGGLMLAKIFNLLFGTCFTDIATCYKLFPKSIVAQLIRSPHNDFVFDIVDLTYQLKSNGRIVEVPISYVARSVKEGKKLNWRHGVKCLIAMIGLKFNLDDLLRRLRLHMVIKNIKGGSVILDVGCGENFWFIKSNKDKFKYSFGIDKRAGFFEATNIKIDNYDIDAQGDLPISENSIDQVFMTAVLEHINYPEQALKKIHDVLKSEGELIITTPTTISKSLLEFLAFRLGIVDRREITDYKNYFSKSELIKLCWQAGFKNIKHKYFELGFNHFIIAKK